MNKYLIAFRCSDTRSCIVEAPNAYDPRHNKCFCLYREA